ncbi:MAG TPA: alpha/beta hydrolase [Longimicrobiales bacterium]|nr:alpha/beta hydrolase [Longimicrobiales bacterium]
MRPGAARHVTTAMLLLLASCAAAYGQESRLETRLLTLAENDTVAVKRAGNGGQTVVIVPGLLGSDFTFRHVVPALLDAGLRVVLVDPLGTGDSGRPDNADYSLEAQAARVEAAMRDEGVTSAIMLCQALGGTICYRLALRAPELVAGIVSVNGGPAEQMATPGLRLALRFAPLIRLIGGGEQVRRQLVSGLVESAADPSWVTREVVEGFTAPYRDVDLTLRTLRRMADAAEPELLAPRLSRITAPVVLLIGAANRSGTGRIDAEQVDAMRAALPRLEIVEVRESGPHIQEEAPHVVVDAVMGMLGEGWTAPDAQTTTTD